MSRRRRRAEGRSVRRRPGIGGLRPAVEAMEPRELLATITVTTLLDAATAPMGQVTLREAITAINAGGSVNPAVIANTTGTFGVDDAIIFTGLAGEIDLVASLPALTRAVLIDGRTGAGFSDRPVITIDGGLSVNNTVTIAGPGVTVRSLAIVGSRGPGILITGASATGSVIQGNHIGVDATGAIGRTNNGGGVVVTGGAGFALIGGPTATPYAPGLVGNVIAANLADHVRLDGAQAVRVQGNFLGTNRAGTAALQDPLAGDNDNGVLIVGGSGHVIGGLTANEGNLISGNAINGVEVRGGAGNLIAANRIGTSADGVGEVRNEFLGIRLQQGATGNTIGGMNASAFALSAGNLIANNGGDGIRIMGAGTTGNLVAGNFVGVDVTGASARQNLDTGIEINAAARNTIGGADPRLGNVISGNRGDGILLTGAGASANLIQGNRIGTNAAGTAAIGNQEDGIEVNGGVGNTIGGAASGAGNLISGNGSDGIELERTSSGNVVQGNLIGTNAAGSAAVANVENGVRLDAGPVTIGGVVEIRGAVANTIGGVNAAAGARTAGNLISGNGRNGVLLVNAATSGNAVLGNFVGTGASGVGAVANALHGILLEGASGNTIGGENVGLTPGTLRAGNLVSGNGGDGIRLAAQVNGQGQVTSLAASNLVLGNFVGTNASGTGTLGNAGAGVALVGAPNTASGLAGNTIGGANASATGLTRGNLISGNARVGLLISGAGVSGNLALGNFIGTNAAGTARLANGRAPTSAGPIDASRGHGVLIELGARSNTIGAGNVVSGNVHSGVVIDASPGNVVTGSRIGTNAAGTAPLGNGLGVPLPAGATDPTEADGNGILLRNGSINTTIGGSNANPGVLTAGNLISGNAGDGVAVHGAGTSGTLIAGNRIGTNLAGTAAVGNDLDGVEVAGASGTTIGGTEPGLRNLISGNGSDGVELERGARLNGVFGNYIGTNAAGDAAIGNRDVGVSLFDASETIVGGNLISGNFDGVRIRDSLATPAIPTSGNRVVGNFIGTNAAGDAAIGNRDDGVQVVASARNTIGGLGAGEANLIAGNASNGVVIGGDGNAATGNLLLGNLIGTNAAGSAGIGNGRDGVLLASGASANTVGGVNATAGVRSAGNLISGNGGSGVRVLGAGASANLLLGNFIGTGANGVLAIGNAEDGVRIEGRSANTIGGANAAAGTLSSGNLISGNARDGVRLEGAGASLNVVVGNRIGTNLAGTARLGNLVGVRLVGARNNAIGDGNVISGNRDAGVLIAGAGATANAVAGNFIGLGPDGSAATGNGGDGVRVEGASRNTIASNAASGNGGAGIALVGAGASANVIRSNRVGTTDDGLAARGNAGGGIRLVDAGGNRIGGTQATEGNIVSGNGGSGVVLQGPGSSGNLIAGNVIGLDAAGSAALGNARDGVAMLGGASGNTVGGAEAPAGNLISGNGGDGVVIAEGSNGNRVAGNVIGANVGGTAARGNGGSGVRISASSGNTVGGRSNLISGNGVFGVAIAGASASGNVIAGNLIGPALSGRASLGTQQHGLVIFDAPNNRVEGGNLIGGHLGDGLQLIGAGASGNIVDANFIGTDEAGREGLSNARGVFLDAASGNAMRGNVISGNRGDGLMMLNGASGNAVTGNLVGLAGPDGAISRGNVSGLLIAGAHGNTFDANVIGGNRGFGVALAAASGNLLTGNLIGTGRQGTNARPNALHGVMVIAATGNTLSGNVISANRIFGVELRDGASNNTLADNLVGTDRTGTVALGNASDGIRIDNAAGNRLERNVSSGNQGNGVMIVANAPGTLLVGNLLGTTRDGSAALGNRGSGVLITGSSGVTMTGNVASANRGFGILIGGGSNNVVSEGFVGTDRTGASALGNALVGVLLLDARNNAVINSVVSANGTNDGGGNVRISGAGATGNVVSGSFIGTDRAGGRSLDPKAGEVRTNLPTDPGSGTPGGSDRVTFDPRNDGIVIVGGASANTIGGAGQGQGNLISGNRVGVYIRGQSPRNVVLGNRIGTVLDGSAALHNGDGVIVMNSSDNTIGGVGAASRNLISGNLEVGVRLTSLAFGEPRAAASGNVVAGNYIGTDGAGNAAIGNRQGIFVYGAAGNRIGLGSYADPNGGGNLLSGNRELGLQILNADTINAVTVMTPAGPVIAPYAPAVGAVTSGNVVSGNRVGTNAAGTARVPNFQGIFLSDAPGNVVADNLISGNVQVGLNITGFNAVNNTVSGNRIGPAVDGSTGAVSNGYGDPNGLGSGLFLNQVVDRANTIAPSNDIRGNAGLQTRVRPIASGPFVEGVTPVLDPVTGALIRVDVRINGYLSRDAARTLNPSNYAIAPGAGGAAFPIASVVYDEVARVVAITPASPLPAGQSYQVTLVGRPPGGLQSRAAAGIAAAFLDGVGNGRAGTNFTRVITVPARPIGAAMLAGAPSAVGVDALAGADDLP